MDLTTAITHATNFINYCKTKNYNYFVVEHTKDLFTKKFLRNDDCKKFRFVELTGCNPYIICDDNELLTFIRLYIKHCNNIDRCRITHESEMVVDENEGQSNITYPHIQYYCVDGYGIYINTLDFIINNIQIQLKEVQDGTVYPTKYWNEEVINNVLSTLRSIHKDEL